MLKEGTFLKIQYVTLFFLLAMYDFSYTVHLMLGWLIFHLSKV